MQMKQAAASAQQADGSAQQSNPDFTVTIVACGTTNYANGGPPNGMMVYAVAVSQPVQSWTVVRNHDDFSTLADVLSQQVAGIPKCPLPKQVENNNDDVTSAIAEARNEMQAWLSSVLMYPGARETQAVRNFLTMGANAILPQYEGVAWTQFSAAAVTSPLVHYPAQGSHSIQAATAAAAAAASGGSPSLRSGPVDDMEMDDMFLEHEDGAGPLAHGGGNDDVDDQEEEEDVDVIPAASERYKPVDEAVTDEDELEILQDAGDVEMIEDIGSLAQSMGASHLGRSLNLQAEMKHRAAAAAATSNSSSKAKPPQPGLLIGRSSAHNDQQYQQGGLGGAMAKAAERANDSSEKRSHPHYLPFNARPLESAPRLDSFKMIRVIGKGSFGKQAHDLCVLSRVPSWFCS